MTLIEFKQSLRQGGLFEYAVVLVFGLFLFFAPFDRKLAKSLIVCAFLFLAVVQCWKCRGRGSGNGRTVLFSDTTNALILFFLISSFFSIAFSCNPYHSQKVFLNRFPLYMALIWCGFMIGKRFGKPQLILLAVCFQAAALFVGVGGVRDFIANFPTQDRLWTVWGMFTSFGMLPLYLSFFISFNFAMLLFVTNRFLRGFSFINLVCLIFFMIWQQSRSLFVAVPVSAIVTGYFKGQRRFLYVLGAVLLALTVFASLSPRIRHNAAAFVDVRKWSNRLPLYKSALRVFLDHPVWGSGVGTFELLIKTPRYELPPHILPTQRHLIIHAHSFYLETLAEMGIMGLAAFGAIFVSFFVLLKRTRRYVTDRFMLAVLMGTVGMVVVELVFGISATIITVGIGESGIFWLFLGLGFGLLKREERYGRNTGQSGR